MIQSATTQTDTLQDTGAVQATRIRPGRGVAFSVAVVLPMVVITVLWLVVTPRFFESGTEFSSFAPDYHPQVVDLREGRGFRSFRYPPVFPLMLTGVRSIASMLGVPSGAVGAVFLLFHGVLGSILIFLLSEGLFGHRLALVAVAGWALYPVFLRMWVQPLSAVPFTVLLLAAVLLFVRSVAKDDVSWWRFAAVGVVLGLAMLTRPIGIGLGILFAFLVFVFARGLSWRLKLAAASVLLTATTLTIMPWEIFAYERSDRVIPLSTGGIASILDGLSFAVDPSEARPVWVPAAVRRLQERIYEESYTELNSSGTIAGYLARELTRDPLAVTGLFAIKAARSWYGTDAGRLDRWVMLLQLIAVPVLGFGVWTAFQVHGPPRDFAVLTAFVVLYFWIMTTISLSIVRYMVPAIAMMMVVVPACCRRRSER
jgi:4-amino-4-deoxy-L-arabinose transferase-like glycosyltransferase